MINQSFPPIHSIEHELRDIDPTIISTMIRSEPETVFLVDYYFRLLDPTIGGRLLSDASFEVETLGELFNCQVIRYYRRNLDAPNYDESYASIIESYWKFVSRERLIELFRFMIVSGRSAAFSAVLMLENLDTENLQLLRSLQEMKNTAILEVFKGLGKGVTKMISSNLDLFDFIYRLASDMNDLDYLKFLDDYTNIIVQLRIAQSMADVAKSRIDSSGKIPLKSLVELIREVPVTSMEVTLQLLKQRNLIDEKTADSLLALQREG